MNIELISQSRELMRTLTGEAAGELGDACEALRNLRTAVKKTSSIDVGGILFSFPR